MMVYASRSAYDKNSALLCRSDLRLDPISSWMIHDVALFFHWMMEGLSGLENSD